MTDISLDALRQQIDQLDSQLVELLAKRSQLTQQVGKYKSQVGLPIYVPSREAELLAKRRQQAEDKGVSADLIEDVLRRIIRESYQTQNNSYLCANPDAGRVVIIGGGGALGSLFVSMFGRSGYQVDVIEQDDWDSASEKFKQAGLVLVSVPIRVTQQVIKQLSNLPEHCILADITSVKSEPLQAMMKAHKGPVVGLHPMFGPGIKSFAKQVVVACEGRKPEEYQWLLEQIKIWGAAVFYTEAQQHDDAMAFIQVMRHFSSFVYGAHLAEEDPDLDLLVSLSSPIYRLELAMVGRLFAQDPVLYADIIFSNQKSIGLLKRFRERLDKYLKLVESGNKEGFIEQFRDIATWFGDYSKQCLQDSEKLLLKADDDRTLSTGI
ncbi:bifunctional chorismate mutase/prephenate dehydrogenase [Paraneptunicella aestuarii]|uniref:bifunctional chorismate mutase/prephenate dehydrogenase n=1 Tax=Paraneptunicella aestuarii TaxID=2831148 RepID=UPI001E503697|nr:bifunctional chorismate mutase/prephenate dehydrogenase [Paraneptunicella aestuarii]UAA40128.1 bifunctional chorismate mutase/prephenate dehydrogenase [Paraneptunicella aestuarii]